MISIFLASALTTNADAAPPLDGQWLSRTGYIATIGGTAAMGVGQATTQFGDGAIMGATGQVVKTGGLIAVPLGLLMSYSGNQMMIGDLRERYLEIDDVAMNWAAGLSLLAVGAGGASYYSQMTSEAAEWQDWLMWTSVAASAGAGFALYVQDKRSNAVYRAGVYHEEYGSLPSSNHFSARIAPTGNGFSLMGTF